MSDIKSKLESLKNLKSEMKDWKKEDIKKKKGIKDPQPEHEKEQVNQPEDTLAKLISKLVKE